MKLRTANLADAGTVAHFLLVWMSVWRLPISFWNWSALRMLPDPLAAGAALEEPSLLFLTMKTTTAATTSAAPSQKMIRLVRGEDREDWTTFIRSAV